MINDQLESLAWNVKCLFDYSFNLFSYVHLERVKDISSERTSNKLNKGNIHYVYLFYLLVVLGKVDLQYWPSKISESNLHRIIEFEKYPTVAPYY